MIDGVTHHTTSLGVGSGPGAATVNPVTNRYYNINTNDNTVSVVAGGSANAVAVRCGRRLAASSTPGAQGGSGPIAGGTLGELHRAATRGLRIPATATAYSLERHRGAATARLGYLTIWPTGAAQPVVSTMNSLDGRIKANAAIVPGGYQGAVSVYVSNTTQRDPRHQRLLHDAGRAARCSSIP